MNDYVFHSDTILFKHERTPAPPTDTYSMHTHDMYELIYFLSGDATHVIEDRKYKLKKGDLILIRPMHYHFIQIDSPVDYERYDFLFDPEKHRLQAAALLPAETEVFNLSDNAMAHDIFRRLDLYRETATPEAFQALLSHLLSELFYNLSIFSNLRTEESVLLSPMISKALHYINENLTTIRSIDELAEHLFVSKSYLFRLFRSELYQTPKKHIMDKRLLLAKSKLESGEKPNDVYEQCGFSDYTTFYRNYLSFFGYPPSAESAY